MGFAEMALAAFVGTSLSLLLLGANRVLNGIYRRFDRVDENLARWKEFKPEMLESVGDRLSKQIKDSEWRIRKEVNPALEVFDKFGSS